MTPDVLYLIVFLFGKESMRDGPFTLPQCIAEQTKRSAELNIYYNHLPPNVGMTMATVDYKGKVGAPRIVFRKDITMECKFDDPPTLRGTLG